MKNEVSVVNTATEAARNASAAALSASEAAKSASENAAIAAKAAADSAQHIAIVMTDTSWIKESVKSIGVQLNEMTKGFVTAAQFAEVVKDVADLQTWSEAQKKSNTTIAAFLSIGTGILGVILTLVINHILK